MRGSSFIGAMIIMFNAPTEWNYIETGNFIYCVIASVTLAGLMLIVSAPKPYYAVDPKEKPEYGRGTGQEYHEFRTLYTSA